MIKLKGDIKFENIKLCNISNTSSPIQNCLHQQIQRPWFQDKYFIKYCKLFFVKNFVTGWNSYLYAQYKEFFYNKLYYTLGPRPFPIPAGILLKIHTGYGLVIMIISWNFEINP